MAGAMTLAGNTTAGMIDDAIVKYTDWIELSE
jgi:hypothetical protein